MQSKETQERTAAVIARMKEIRRKKELTSQDIFEMVEASGGFVSLSSIKRVFADGSENVGFRYRDTIQPIAKVLLEIDEEMTAGTNADVESIQLDALKEVALLKEQLLAELKEENSALKAEVEYLVADHKRKNKIILSLAVALAVIVFSVICVLIYDKTRPDIGWIRTAAVGAQGAFAKFNSWGNVI